MMWGEHGSESGVGGPPPPGGALGVSCSLLTPPSARRDHAGPWVGNSVFSAGRSLIFLFLLPPAQRLACPPSQAPQGLRVPQALEGLRASQEHWQPTQLRTPTASGVN